MIYNNIAIIAFSLTLHVEASLFSPLPHESSILSVLFSITEIVYSLLLISGKRLFKLFFLYSKLAVCLLQLTVYAFNKHLSNSKHEANVTIVLLRSRTDLLNFGSRQQLRYNYVVLTRIKRFCGVTTYNNKGQKHFMELRPR